MISISEYLYLSKCAGSFFILMVSGREGSVFHKSYQQLFPPIYHELGITEFHLSKKFQWCEDYMDESRFQSINI